MRPHDPPVEESETPGHAHLEAALAQLAGWQLGTGGGGVSLTREYLFPTADLGQGFAALAAGLAAVFRHQPVWSVLGRVVKISLGDVEQRSVTSRHLALARAFNTLHRGFCEAAAPATGATLSGPSATVLSYPGPGDTTHEEGR